MNCVPLTSESPSFACERAAARARRARAPRRPASRSPSNHASPSPTSGSARCASGARSPLAPTEPRLGTTGSTPAVEALEQQLDELRPRAGAPLRERVRAQQHRRADDLVRVRVADAARVAAQQPELELLGQLLRDRLRDEAAEAGVDAVGVLARGRARRGRRRARAATIRSARRVGERRRRALDRDRPDVVDGQVLAGEADRRSRGSRARV